MTAMLTIDDLTTISEEPLVLDELLAERLEFERPRTIRQLIERNSAELQTYGEVCCIVQQTSPEGGRPGKAYYLNEDQAVLVSMFSRTPKAAEVRKALITIYNQWRREHPAAGAAPQLLLPPPPPATVINVASPPAAAPGVPHDDNLTLRDKIAFITLTRQIHGQAAAQAMWPVMGLPEVRLGPVSQASADKQAEALACLQLLLSHSLGSTDGDTDEEDTIFTTIQEALNGEADAIMILKSYGLRLLDEGEGGNRLDETVVWVANHAKWLTRIFSDSPWADAWLLTLKHLPGAVAGQKPHKTEGTISQGTCIPIETIAMARPGAELTWHWHQGDAEGRRKRALNKAFRAPRS